MKFKQQISFYHKGQRQLDQPCDFQEKNIKILKDGHELLTVLVEYLMCVI